MDANQWFSIAVGADVRESHDVLQGVEYAGFCGTSEFEFVITSEFVDMLDDQSLISNCYDVLRFIVPSEGNNQ